MPRKKQPEPEPIPPIPFPKEQIDDLWQIADALEKIRKQIRYRLQRNRREANLLQRAEFTAQTLALQLDLANRQAVEPDPSN